MCGRIGLRLGIQVQELGFLATLFTREFHCLCNLGPFHVHHSHCFVVGQLLVEIPQRKGPCFVVCTASDVAAIQQDQLNPEFLHSPLHLLQQEGGQVGLLEANLFRGHLGGQRHDGRLHSCLHELFLPICPGCCWAVGSELVSVNENVTAFHTLGGPPNVHTGDLRCVLPRLHDQGIGHFLLKDGVFVTTQNHWSFTAHGLMHLELFGQKTIVFDQLMCHGHHNVNVLTLAAGVLPSRHGGVHEVLHIWTAVCRVDRRISDAQADHEHLLATHVDHIVLGQGLQLVVHAVGVQQLAFVAAQPCFQLSFTQVKLMVSQGDIVQFGVIQGFHHGDATIQRGMQAGSHEVATHVRRDHALHGFAEPFGLSHGRGKACVVLQGVDIVDAQQPQELAHGSRRSLWQVAVPRHLQL
mmetsp:Transcript_75251/g.119493  ORF Transcript_75251/g.119493 Transcript_75251/m.119493 type:complete len:410 (-) Transcript_75251:58-1287(-)